MRPNFFQIFRKVAFKIVKEGQNKIVVDDGNLQEFVGKPIYTTDRMYELTPPGVSMGLAWTANGRKRRVDLVIGSVSARMKT